MALSYILTGLHQVTSYSYNLQSEVKCMENSMLRVEIFSDASKVLNVN